MQPANRRSNRSWWTAERRPSPWSSGAVAVVVTASLFAAAFVAMTTMRHPFIGEPQAPIARPIVVVLTPSQPRELTPPRAPSIPQITTRAVPAAPNPLPAMPTEVAPATPRAAQTDTARVASDPAPRIAIPLIPTVPLRDYSALATDSARPAAAGGRGPVGITAYAGKISAAQRDSLAAAVIMQVPKLAASRKPTPDEIDALRRQREPGLDSRGRAARLPGELVYAPTMGGNAHVGIAMISFALPGGRDRAKDSAVHSDNVARLRRLQDLALWRRDSIRADSLRRDSLARQARAVRKP